MKFKFSEVYIYIFIYYVFSAFGFFTLFTFALDCAGQTFQSLTYFGILAFILPILLPFNFSNNKKIEITSELKKPKLIFLLVPAPFLFLIQNNNYLFWIILSIINILIIVNIKESSKNHNFQNDKISIKLASIFVIILSSIVVLLVLGSARPDADDALYISIASSALDYPEKMILGFDSLYKTDFSILAQKLHTGQSIEYFVAFISKIFGLQIHDLYYILFPIFFGILGIGTNYILAREFIDIKSSIVFIFVLIVILCFYGDGHRTFGNFSFNRMQQGKSIYLWCIVPLLIKHVIVFAKSPSLSNWILSCLLFITSVGITTNAIVITPIICVLTMLATLKFSKANTIKSCSILAALIPLIVIGIKMKININSFNYGFGADPVHFGYESVFGNRRSTATLYLICTAPILTTIFHIKNNQFWVKYTCLTVLIILNPITQKLTAAYIANVFSWRLFWVVPAPFILALLFTLILIRFKNIKYLSIKICMLSIVTLFVISGDKSINSQNWSLDNFYRYNVNNYFDHANYINNNTNSDLTIAPQNISINLCTLPNAPPLVAVRLQYFDVLVGSVPNDELKWRREMLKFASNKKNKSNSEWFCAKVNEKKINQVILYKNNKHLQSVKAGLLNLNFKFHEYKDIVIFRK